MFNKLGDEIAEVFILTIVPDTCDIAFLKQITIYRIDSLQFLNNNDTEYLTGSLNLKMQD